MIKARDPWLHCISVAYEGFMVPEGIPIPELTKIFGHGIMLTLFFLLILIICRHILFVVYDINPFLLGCPSHFQT